MIVDRIERLPALPAHAYEPHVAQQPELVRHGRLADPHPTGEVVDAQLPFTQRFKDADACGVPENPKRVGN